MKKLLFLALFIAGANFANAQGVFKIGATAGIAVSEKDLADWVWGVDTYYMIEKEDAIFNFGPTASFRNFAGVFKGFEDEYDGDARFINLGAAGRFKLLGILNMGVDAGYAIGISDYLDGGFYLRPIVGIDIFNVLEFNVSYENYFNKVNHPEDPKFAAVTFGLLLEL